MRYHGWISDKDPNAAELDPEHDYVILLKRSRPNSGWVTATCRVDAPHFRIPNVEDGKALRLDIQAVDNRVLLPQ